MKYPFSQEANFDIRLRCKICNKTQNSILFFLHEQQQEQDPTNLYISNLPLSMDEKELENMLQPFGQVVSTRILRDYSGNSRGVGFARLVTDRNIVFSFDHSFDKLNTLNFYSGYSFWHNIRNKSLKAENTAFTRAACSLTVMHIDCSPVVCSGRPLFALLQ